MILKLEKILNQIPLLPQSISELFQIINDPAADPSDLVRIVESDPALAMHALQICNSAYYSLPVEISSVAHATRLLGTDTVTGLAMAAYFQGMVNQIPDAKKNFWILDAHKHYLATAKLSETMVHDLGCTVSPATTFTGGLLHDIGKMVFARMGLEYSEQVQDLMDNDEMSLIEAEQAVFSVDHTEIGCKLAQRWDMPEVIQDIVEYHHRPLMGEFQQTIYVYLADTIYHHVKNQLDIQDLRYLPDMDKILQEIGMNDEQLTLTAEKYASADQASATEHAE